MNTFTIYIKHTIYFFALLVILFFPAEFHFFPWQHQISEALFGPIIHWIGSNIFNLEIKNSAISSDSVAMYLLFLVLFIKASFISILLYQFKNWRLNRERCFSFLRTIFTIYLAIMLFKYGFDKIFKCQFYLPEPNILFTPFGQMSKDIIYWSSMGTSRSYSIFAGLLEIIPAFLILFKKTRTLGLLIAMAVMINVIAINFSFDISVKLFSMFLLFVVLLLLQPQVKHLFNFLLQNKTATLNIETNSITFDNSKIKPIIKSLIVLVCLLEGLNPYLTNQNFNDDNFARPYLHGVYEVYEDGPLFTNVRDEMAEVANRCYLRSEEIIKRIFIHRVGYLIFQNGLDQMIDYKLQIDQENKTFTLTNYQLKDVKLRYNYTPNDSILVLQHNTSCGKYWLRAKAINWRKLPALQHDFHWTVDSYK